jgi:hypothetical protein
VAETFAEACAEGEEAVISKAIQTAEACVEGDKAACAKIAGNLEKAGVSPNEFSVCRAYCIVNGTPSACIDIIVVAHKSKETLVEQCSSLDAVVESVESEEHQEAQDTAEGDIAIGAKIAQDLKNSVEASEEASQTTERLFEGCVNGHAK